MYKNTKNTKTLISEMKTMLNNKPGKKGLLEGLVYGEDEENMMGPEMEQPSELGNEKQEVPTTETTETKIETSVPEQIIALLGGRDNITLVDACMTRLRVTVKDPEKVAEIDKWRENGALGLFKKGNGIQAVYGPKADILKSDINDIL